jgi:hypothetical protein
LTAKNIVGNAYFIAAFIEVIGCTIAGLPPTCNGGQCLLIEISRAITLLLKTIVIEQFLCIRWKATEHNGQQKQV